MSIFPSRRTTTHASVRTLYDRAAVGWQKGLERIGYGEAYATLARKAHAVAPLNQPVRILDAGTGTGALAAAFVQGQAPGCKVDLLDLSPQMLSLAGAAVGRGSRCIVGGIGSSDVQAAAYDRVLCGHVIEHCPDPQAALDWLHGRLRPGGWALFAISKPHWCTALVRWKYGSSAYEPDMAEQMLSRAGFGDVTRLPHSSGPPSRISCGYLARRI